jgi:hypothetical protein
LVVVVPVTELAAIGLDGECRGIHTFEAVGEAVAVAIRRTDRVADVLTCACVLGHAAHRGRPLAEYWGLIGGGRSGN